MSRWGSAELRCAVVIITFDVVLIGRRELDK
jgi:hypothetical protein